VIDKSIKILEKRFEYFNGARVAKGEKDDQIIVELPRVKVNGNPNETIPTGKLEFRLVDTTVSAHEAWMQRVGTPLDDDLPYEAGRPGQDPMLIKKQVLVDGAEINDAQPSFDQRTNEPIVNLKFSKTGTAKLGRATQENVGRSLAIVLDDAVITAPVIREPIVAGSMQIAGNFTVENANALAHILRTGALPVKFKAVDTTYVPPTASPRH
jgi:preprotein translocase subunit SecD